MEDFATGLEEKKGGMMCSFLKSLSQLIWEMVILLTERRDTGVIGVYGGDNQFGFGNSDPEVLQGNLTVVTSQVLRNSIQKYLQTNN